jgi:pimeloyl-ACP methyl ester carboxylesterase
MKRNIKFFIAVFLCPLFVSAQNASNWGAINQRFDVKNYLGKKFKLEAAVKVTMIDSAAEAEIWVRVDKPNKKMGFFYNMMDKPIRSRDWKVYSIIGKIDKDAEYLAFGGLYHRKGIFFFDDFKLSFETSENKFEEVKINDGNFETDSLSPNWYFHKKQDGYTLSLVKDEFYAGNRSCKVDGSQLIVVPTFGNNETKGKYSFVNGVKIYYETYGEGKPLLLLHGNSESIYSFRLQIAEFSKEYKVIAMDTRGHGKSSEDSKTYTYDLFADDVNALLDHLNLDSVNILGWSDGGNTGLIMAMKYPKKVHRLVSMGANIFIDNSVVKKEIFKELNKQLKELKDDTTNYSKNRIRLINLLLTEPKHRFDELKTISCPVLVLAGEKDIIKEEHTKSIASSIYNSTLIIAPKETHYYPWENASAFNKTVLDFLKE